MDLSEYEYLPGVVINVDDPEKRGRIKASVPTWFDTSVMQEEALPWIVPLSMGGFQRFSKLEMGSKVFVFHRKKSNKEYWYIPMFELNDDTQEIVNDYDSPEVLLARNDGQSGVYVYYNTKDGLVLRNGDLEVILNNDKEIHITDGTSSFDIVGSLITIGKKENQQPALMGQDVKNLLEHLAANFQKLNQAASSYPLSPLAPHFLKAYEDLETDIQPILSDTVKISK